MFSDSALLCSGCSGRSIGWSMCDYGVGIDWQVEVRLRWEWLWMRLGLLGAEAVTRFRALRQTSQEWLEEWCWMAWMVCCFLFILRFWFLGRGLVVVGSALGCLDCAAADGFSCRHFLRHAIRPLTPAKVA